ncbi:hypothetical protein H072_1747 [Dactylellina haptotyla CBS 200.50]|uniref:Uncharacterized protein n=1 Tax=Dactylellina haptotyla (strain CBS 200.50) TaxID=1284197 RepID=S8AMW0_DACHA|nr:hypothetical protein H072_1747 [Dactylellina haptotyla CBS 200.50]
MSHTGGNAVLLTKTSGVQCVPLGYIENETTDHGLDNCFFRDSLWTVSYTSNVTVSGSARTKWHQDIQSNTITLEKKSSPNTYICGSPSLCGNTEDLDWEAGGKGPIYLNTQNPSSPPLISSAETNAEKGSALLFEKVKFSIDIIEEYDKRIKATQGGFYEDAGMLIDVIQYFEKQVQADAERGNESIYNRARTLIELIEDYETKLNGNGVSEPGSFYSGAATL